MCALFLSGSLDRELQRVGLGDRTIAAGAETRPPRLASMSPGTPENS